MRSPSSGKVLSPLLAYFAIIIGLIILKNAWFAILLYHLGIILIMSISAKRKSLPDLTSGWNARITLILSAASIGGGLALACNWSFIKLPTIAMNTRLAYFGLRDNIFYLFVIYYVISTPILEELFWRGHLLETKKYPCITDVLFSGYHMIVLALFIKAPWVLFSFFALILMAWVWRRIVLSTGGLIIPIISHTIAGLSLMGAVWHLHN